ncbi:MAG: M1 family metallopeptidase [Nitrososphaerales archaeon]|nr:M1 family metallopeptidase [Nitrososphaerales archaeon]
MHIDSYDLDLNVDFARANVEGVVKLTVETSANPLLLDAQEMSVNAVAVNGRPTRFRYGPKEGALSVFGVPKKQSEVSVSYSKQVSDQTIFGLYKSKYGKDYMLVTDLEPAAARTVFPCKDEPTFKAVFRLTVTTERGLEVISNSSVKSRTETSDGRVRHVFNQSPRMSTYLFFMGIGKFEETRMSSGRTEVIAATRAGASHQSEFILDISTKVLKDYEEYFGIRYPLEKLHLVALPEYHAGAMENWGAITSREAYVLLDKNSSFFDHRHAAYVMTHEIAHQWFGDLVTMKWWDDLWLNESFATFMEHKMIHRLHPEWDVWREFLRFETFRSMSADALFGTHPIQARVTSVKEIHQVFDAISYGKGAAVLRMIESYVGEAAFRTGVRAYLRKFSHANASGEDLWKSIARASGLPVTRVMSAWVMKPGFPVVKVKAVKGGVRLSQNRFLLSGKKARGVWPIPLTMRVGGKETKMLLDRNSALVKAKMTDDFIVNLQRTGFYSVLYDEETYGELANRFQKLHAHDRAGIMTDLFLFLHSGMVDPETYFKFVSLCGASDDPLVIETVTDQLATLRTIADEARIVSKGYADFYLPVAGRLGLTAKEGEDPNLGSVRETLMAQLVRVDRGYAAELAPRFENFADVEPNLKAAVAIAYAVVNGSSAYDPLVKLTKSSGEVDRTKAYSALTSFEDPSLVEKVLELGISGEVSRSDSGYTVTGAATNPRARKVTWGWIEKRWDRLNEIYGGAQEFYLYLDRAVPRCGVGSEDEVKAFISGERFREGHITFRRVFELLDIYSRLRQRLLSA